MGSKKSAYPKQLGVRQKLKLGEAKATQQAKAKAQPPVGEYFVEVCAKGKLAASEIGKGTAAAASSSDTDCQMIGALARAANTI